MGGWQAEEEGRHQERAQARAAAPGDGHRGRARTHAATGGFRGTGGSPVQAARREGRRTGQARARAAVGGTQDTARGPGRDTAQAVAGEGRRTEQARAQAAEEGTQDTAISAADPHLLRFSQICPRLATLWPFYTIRRNRRPPDDSQGLNYRILTCRIQRCCPFIVDPPRSDDLPRIAICRWCACATQIGHTFFQIGFK